jgi:hypothetical protein
MVLEVRQLPSWFRKKIADKLCGGRSQYFFAGADLLHIPFVKDGNAVTE